MADLDLKSPNFAGGVKRNVDPVLLPDNALADAQNFLPWAATGGAEKVKVWHKDLLELGDTGADDRIWVGSTVIDADSGDLEAADPFLPRFDNIEKVFYFYSNCFDDGATNYGTTNPALYNAPIVITGENWATNYTYYEPIGSATILAGFYLSTDVVLTQDKPLYVSVPVRENGAYNAATHAATCDLYFIDGTQPGTTIQATGTVNLGAAGLGRIEFAIFPDSDREILSAGEYYVSITQATTTPTVDGYSFLGPVTYTTGTNAKLFGWAHVPGAAAIVNEAVLYTEYTATIAGNLVEFDVDHTFAYGPPLNIEYTDDIVIQVYYYSVAASTYRISCRLDMDTQTVSINADTWSSGTLYLEDQFVAYGGSVYKLGNATSLNEQPDINPTIWGPVSSASLAFGSDGFPNSISLRYYFSATYTTMTPLLVNEVSSGGGYTHTAKVDYTGASYIPLAEMCVYQKTTEDASFTVSANALYKGSRYTQKNAEMPASGTVRTDNVMPIYAITDGHSIFALYQEIDKDDAIDGELLVGGAMLNTLNQYTRWNTSVGVQSPAPIYYYLPKFLGEIRCFETYQNRMVFGGVGGLAIFDPRNLLEGLSKGKVYTPWKDIIIPDINQRLDSDYLTAEAVTPVDVHPPTIRALMIYGDDPGRVIAVSHDTVFVSGGSVADDVSNVWDWQALAVFEPGDTADEVLGMIYFDSHGLIYTQRGDLYDLIGTPATDFSVSFGSFDIRKVRRIGVIKHIVDTNLGYLIYADDSGSLYKLDGGLIPVAWGDEITTDTLGNKADLNITGLRWDNALRRLWIHSDGFTSRTYADGPDIESVTVSARSYVWDADSNSFWPVVNPLDEADRDTAPAVFREGNVSWSAGYYFDSTTNQYTFVLECDIAGTDPLPLKNDAESLTQPENSTFHATESTAFLLGKLYQGDDHALQVRYLQALARLIDGTDCTLSLICEGEETSLGAFSGSTDFETLAHKIATKKLFKSPRVNSFQIKLTITNQYADIVRNLAIKANFAGHLA